MTSEMIVAIFSMVGTLAGSLIGLVASAKLTNHRIQELEKKVDKHNGFAERIPVIEEKIKVVNHRVSNLEEMCRK